MFFEFETYEYYLKSGATDMRCGARRLAQLVVTEMEMQPLSRRMFVFCSKNRKTLKILVWDGNGFWLSAKKLHKGTFAWPKDEEQAKQVRVEDLKRVLQGQDCWRTLPYIYGTYAG